jgi:citrate lyase beta subunit
VRNTNKLVTVLEGLTHGRHALTGFVIPKFDDDPESTVMDVVRLWSAEHNVRYLVMPVLEGRTLAKRETRDHVLSSTAETIDKHRDIIPCVRIGATDLSGTFGLRRPPDLTVYDLAVVRDAISDIINVFARPEHIGVISGCVWEYFTHTDRVLKPQLRVAPFEARGEHGLALRKRLLQTDSDALIRELLLDKANGLIGKTLIHPTHAIVVHSMLAVTAEEYADALSVLDETGGGVTSSPYGNKMNERRPHAIWAQRVLIRSRAFGVLRDDVSFADVIATQTEFTK